ncbi:MAG: hypothetical protein ABH873_06015 [Candidatus Firestonebacteria bacterium]
MIMDKISKISFFITLIGHTIIVVAVGIIISMPAKEYIPLVEISLVNLPKKLTEGINLPGGPSEGTKEKIQQPKSTESLLPPSEVGVTQDVGLINSIDIVGSGVAKNLFFREGKVAGFSFTGSGIRKAKPDNVFIKFSVISDISNTLRAAEISIGRKIDFVIYNVGRRLSIKKEDFKVTAPKLQMIEQVIKAPSSDDKGGSSKKEHKYTIAKNIIVNNLGNRKLVDICEIIDMAINYGAVAISQTSADNPSWVQSSKALGEKNSSVSSSRGMPKTNVDFEMQSPSNELINYYLKAETFERMIKEAKDEALQDAKKQVENVKKVLHFDEKEMEIKFDESTSTLISEEDEIVVKVDVTAVLYRPKKSEKDVELEEFWTEKKTQENEKRMKEIMNNIENIKKDVKDMNVKEKVDSVEEGE